LLKGMSKTVRAAKGDPCTRKILAASMQWKIEAS
jgi:hypothetical protein